MKLTIELVPSTSWGNNVRSMVSRSQWDLLRKECYAQANFRCEICNMPSRKIDSRKGCSLEAHERWHYEESTHQQTLTGLLALCPNCHRVKHIGHSINNGLGAKAFAHLMQVNGISLQKAETLVLEAFRQWQQRSEWEWQVNIDWLHQRTCSKNGT